jgi:hypothetical protein
MWNHQKPETIETLGTHLVDLMFRDKGVKSKLTPSLQSQNRINKSTLNGIVDKKCKNSDEKKREVFFEDRREGEKNDKGKWERVVDVEQCRQSDVDDGEYLLVKKCNHSDKKIHNSPRRGPDFQADISQFFSKEQVKNQCFAFY